MARRCVTPALETCFVPTTELDYGDQLVLDALKQCEGEKPGWVFNHVHVLHKAPEMYDALVRKSLFRLERQGYVRRHRVPGRYAGTTSKTLYWSSV